MLPVCVLSCRVPSNSGRTSRDILRAVSAFEQTLHRRIWSIRIHTHHARCLREEVREQRIGSRRRRAPLRRAAIPRPAWDVVSSPGAVDAAGRENG